MIVGLPDNISNIQTIYVQEVGNTEEGPFYKYGPIIFSSQ